MRPESYALLKKLVETKTIHDNETALCLYLQDYLKDYAEKIVLVGTEPNRQSIVAYFGNLESENVLLFNGHLDVVTALEPDWESDPFVMTERDGRIYARGIADMKAGIAASILAIIAAKEEGLLEDKLVIFAGSSDEESGADSLFGCKLVVEHLLAEGIRPLGVLIPEPSPDGPEVEINLGHRGLMWIQCEVEGTVVHSGLLLPEDNAIRKMYGFAEALYALFPQEAAEIDGVPPSSCRMTHIHAGTDQGFRRTPAKCVADFDVRISPLERNEEVLAKITEIADTCGVTVSVIKNTPASSAKKDDRIVRVLEAVLQGEGTPYRVGYAS
ncbi:MAG: M20/M25/M40 family metallo-hydrolase, partial [Oscillospiraceae bacterium]|nr:M20/M25/M40 family metallo-hydrolase [Oscillospiraceae bacterium]